MERSLQPGSTVLTSQPFTHVILASHRSTISTQQLITLSPVQEPALLGLLGRAAGERGLLPGLRPGSLLRSRLQGALVGGTPGRVRQDEGGARLERRPAPRDAHLAQTGPASVHTGAGRLLGPGLASQSYFIGLNSRLNLLKFGGDFRKIPEHFSSKFRANFCTFSWRRPHQLPSCSGPLPCRT